MDHQQLKRRKSIFATVLLSVACISFANSLSTTAAHNNYDALEEWDKREQIWKNEAEQARRDQVKVLLASALIGAGIGAGFGIAAYYAAYYITQHHDSLQDMKQEIFTAIMSKDGVRTIPSSATQQLIRTFSSPCNQPATDLQKCLRYSGLPAQRVKTDIKNASREVKFAYARGALPSAKNSHLPQQIIADYVGGLDAKAQEYILCYRDDFSTDVTTINPHDLIWPLDDKDNTGLAYLMRSYHYSRHTVRPQILAKISEVIEAYPDTINDDNKDTFRSTAFLEHMSHCCKDGIISHDILDVLLANNAIRWNKMNLYNMNALMLFFSVNENVRFNTDQKQKEKDKALLTLMAQQCGISLTDDFGNTALIFALENKADDEVLCSLLDLKADPGTKTFWRLGGKTALEFARSKNKDQKTIMRLQQAMHGQ